MCHRTALCVWACLVASKAKYRQALKVLRKHLPSHQRRRMLSSADVAMMRLKLCGTKDNRHHRYLRLVVVYRDMATRARL